MYIVYLHVSIYRKKKNDRYAAYLYRDREIVYASLGLCISNFDLFAWK